MSGKIHTNISDWVETHATLFLAKKRVTKQFQLSLIPRHSSSTGGDEIIAKNRMWGRGNEQYYIYIYQYQYIYIYDNIEQYMLIFQLF